MIKITVVVTTLEQRERMKKYYQEHREEIIKKQVEYLKKRRKDPLWRQKRREYQKRYDIKHREEKRKRAKQYRENIRLEVLTHYGGNPPRCNICGFSNINALSLDHINGGGTRHRMRIKRSGVGFYLFLKKKGFPKNYQVLCMNCQFIKERE